MKIRAGFAQVAPVWLNGAATLEKVADQVSRAADDSVQLLVFGEALVPGYPFWPELTEGAVFESDQQKDLFAHYAEQAVDIAGGELNELSALCGSREIAIYLGCIERATDRSAHSLYASLVYIGPDGKIGSVHRKLCPTYEERLNWSPGDGHGLQVHDLAGFRALALTVGKTGCRYRVPASMHRAKTSMRRHGRAAGAIRMTSRASWPGKGGLSSYPPVA